jgi:hypothetical protein
MHSHEDARPGGDEDAPGTGQERPPDYGLMLASLFALGSRSAASSWMWADLARLRAAFPAFSFGICRGSRGLMFEAWRDTVTSGLYAVITPDAREIWRELEACQPGREAPEPAVNLTPGQLDRISRLGEQWSLLWDKRRSLWIAAEDDEVGEQLEEADLDVLLDRLDGFPAISAKQPR